jgi:sugar phosphate isomerase/epimerase
MCFGHDGEGALRESLERKGASRRNLIRGAFAGAAGAAALGAGVGAAAPAAASGKRHDRGHGHGRSREVPLDRISIQLYTLRAAMTNPDGVDLVLRRLSQWGYERVERAGLYHYTAADMKKRLDELGIWASSSHDGIAADAAGLNKKLDDANTFGQKYINVAYLNSPDKAQWQRWAEQMNTEAAVARKRGLRYGYHNHAHEFTIDLGGGTTPWDVFMAELDPKLVHLEVDLYWAYTAGVNLGEADPLAFANDVVRQAPLEVRQYHVKDRDGATGDMADLGTGVIDFPKIFRKHQVEEYIVENDTPDVSPLTSAAVGKLYLEHTSF